MGDENDLRQMPPNQNIKDDTGDEPKMGSPDAEASPPEKADDPSMISQDAIDNVLRDMAGMGQADETPEDAGEEGPTVNKADFQQLSIGNEKRDPKNIDLLMDVDLPVSIELGRTRMKIADILALGPGSVVELDKLVGEAVDLLVNQKCVARGEVVVVEESFGLRITQLMSPEERIKNLQ
ncbi:flagellar motor switching and energizing component (modular protein) [Candidatus Zixiibacteriota bacterium]|nr:flagellar motor switching and energizing component (modular protein) [candidate division Zixibacteria bacterium]